MQNSNVARIRHPDLEPRPWALKPTVPFIDREGEIKELRAALDAALGGHGRVMLLGGEPGIGKTRLASVLAAQAESRGVPVWWGRGWEDGSAPPFWPWNMALRRWIDQVGHDAVAAAVGSWGAELAHVFPVLRDCMPELPPSEGRESAGARFRLFDLVSRFLAAVARPAGLVVVLDDLHWADGPSLKLLEFIAADLTDTRLLVLATYRDTEVERDDPCFTTLSRVAREPASGRLLLSGLAPAYCARWVASTGLPGDPAALGAALHRETNGNPFFMGEIVHLLASEDHLAARWDAQRVPQGVHELIARRLDRLGEDCRATLAVAALLGDTIDAGMLTDLLGNTPLAHHLERAVRDRILIEGDGGHGHYRFAHALIRRFLVDELQPSARTTWHALIATVLERQAKDSDVVTAELVRHLAAAGTPAALRKAFDYACRGAEQAARGLGWEEAVRLYEIAFDVGRRSGLLNRRRAIELRLALARALRAAGDVDAARLRCDEVIDAADAGGEHEYAAAVRHMRAMTRLAIGEPEAFSTEVDGLATAAAASRVPEALWLADALAALRATLQGRFGEARDAMERALATGRRMHLANAAGLHATQRIMWHAFQGRLAEIEPEIDAFVEQHDAGGWRPVRALARLACGDVLAARAEFHSLLATGLVAAERGVMARCYLAALAALCVALREREHAPMLYDLVQRRDDVWSADGCQTLGPWALALGGLARLCGRSADAVRHFENAIQLGRRMGSPPIVARAQSLLASVRLSMQPDANERSRIAEMLAEAARCADELGLVDVAARVERLQGKVGEGAVDAGTNIFRCDGDVWTVRYAGREVRLKDGKGPRYLAILLGAPAREVHVLAFVAASAAPSASGVHEGLSIGLPGGSLDDGPDQRARREYRARLDDLRAELDEAEHFSDGGRAERLRAELEQLVAHLAARFGTRPALRGPAETARKAVTKVLRSQIGKLLDLHPELGRHLRDTVRTGTVCVYAPPTPVSWDVGFGPR